MLILYIFNAKIYILNTKIRLKWIYFFELIVILYIFLSLYELFLKNKIGIYILK